MQHKRKLIISLILTLGFILAGSSLAAENTFLSTQVFLPLTLYKPAPAALTDVWVAEQVGVRTATYTPGETVEYHLQGENPSNAAIDVLYRWQQTGDCGDYLIHEETLTLPPGDWAYHYPGILPDCLGTQDNTVIIAYDGYTSTLSTAFDIVDTSSQIVISEAHGFDKCWLPTIEQMEAWQQDSPYEVFNIYLGGEHFACNLLIDADWVRATAGQGWGFILTWVGHATSCWEGDDPEDHPISADPAAAYLEGRAAADEAVAAARDLGFLGEKVIYYDVEGYEDDNPTCRPAMKAFLAGWAARLHESGDKAGAYGSPCRSYIMDWVDNDPPLDDIWFARWRYAAYNPEATVWEDPNSACALPDDVWPDQQRLRQYTPSHAETWGECDGAACRITSLDSNVLSGEITILLFDE